MAGMIQSVIAVIMAAIHLLAMAANKYLAHKIGYLIGLIRTSIAVL